MHSATNWKVLVSWRKQEEKINNISYCQFYYFMIFIFFIPNRCGPCHAIAPKLDELSQKYVIVNFLKVDVDRCMVSQYFHLKKSNQFDVFHNLFLCKLSNFTAKRNFTIKKRKLLKRRLKQQQLVPVNSCVCEHLISDSSSAIVLKLFMLVGYHK